MLNHSQGPSPITSAPETPGSPSELGVKGRKDTEMGFKDPPAPGAPWASAVPDRQSQATPAPALVPLELVSWRAFGHPEGRVCGCGLAWGSVACALQMKGKLCMVVLSSQPGYLGVENSAYTKRNS